MNIAGLAVLITGGRRIGAVVATDLATRGADIALGYNRSRAEAQATAAAVQACGRQATFKQVDLASGRECAELVAHTVEEFGRLDVLINMASLYGSKPFEQLTEQDFDASLAIDLRGAFLCSHAAVPHMRAAGGGRIINFSDWLAFSHRPRYKGYLPYFVAKAGVIGLTEALALELAESNILVNAIAPGPIAPPPGLDGEELKAVEQATPLGRWGGESQIAKAVVALIETDFVTGEIVRVDGGRHLR
jgi:NAD(P)-dependent dehydrogenase (short-subunit alcohol dehydrogenase family)